MPSPNVLVIAVDGLRASALGAYGNTWYRTPTLDRIAAQSILCDWCFADSTELSLIYRGLWQSTAALRPKTPDDTSSLLQRLSMLGYATRIITDDRELAEFPAVQQFAEAVLLENQTVEEVREVEQTCAASMMAEVLNFLEDEHSTHQPWFLWAHLKGLYGVWDAPHELALSLVEEDDTPPEQTTEPPNRSVDRNTQADAIFAESCRYAAQVMALDSLLAPLSEMLDSGAAGECILVVLGTRGFPLGEHGQLGGVDNRLYSEQTHVPLLLRLPHGQGGLSRISQLVQGADLPTTILAALAESVDTPRDGLDFLRLLDDPHESWRSFVLSRGSEEFHSIRTPAWYLREPRDAQSAELFVKPDDRWDVNNIASRCPDLAAELTALATAERERMVAGEPISLAVLPPELVEPFV